MSHPAVTTILWDEDSLEALAKALAPYLAPLVAAPQASVSDDGWLTTKEAAAYVGVTADAIRKHTATRSIPFEQDGPGCKCWFKRSELDAWRRGEWRP